MSSGVLAACFSPERLSARLPRPGSWHPYPAIPDRAAWDAGHPAPREEVRARVRSPYRDSDQWWWLGLRKQDLNNWTPWIHSSLLLATLLLDTRPEDIAGTAGRAVAALDRYLDAAPEDGGCDEGIGYWWRAAACSSAWRPGDLPR